MNPTNDDIDQKSHFAFGKNWASYAETITEDKIEEAKKWLRRLVGDSLSGKRFLDIGCGSGIHSLAALRLGASEVVGIDLDADSVATTIAVLTRHAPNMNWRASVFSVFDLDKLGLGQFDVVYSWGVLHHTGDMYRALHCASTAVTPRGMFVFALYRVTAMCWFWKIEKRWYAHSSRSTQAFARSIYVAFFWLGKFVTRGRFRAHVAQYSRNRGMDFYHDVHDWLGGWPYESISPEQVEVEMATLNFQPHRVPARQKRSLGIFGSGCDEFVYCRIN